MDYIINQEQLNSKKIELNTMKTNVIQVTKDISSGYLNKIKGTEISSIINKVLSSSERLKKGYNNSYDWLNRYTTEINNLEETLCNFKATEFKSEFLDIFSKQTMSLLKTKSEPVLTDIEQKKKDFIGDVDDTSAYYIDPAYTKKLKRLTLFDNTTGEEIKDGGTIHMKPGETRIITVKLPNNAGAIDKVIRTTSDGDDSYNSGRVVTGLSDINPDPNVISYVNYKNSHYPNGVNLHTNYYEWVITAVGSGIAAPCQTCEYKTTDGRTPKAMVEIKVVVD